MADQPLGVGLIGRGDIAPAHAQAIARVPGLRLAACMDVVASSAKSLGEEHGVPYTTDAEELVSRQDVDIVTVATPAFTHADLVALAARVGKAVICEKPLAPDLASADRLIAACARAKVALATCFPLRYLGAAEWVRELLAAGALGKVFEIRLADLSEKPLSYWTGGYSGRTQTDWRRSKASSGGGVVITNLTHHLDLARSLTGFEVTRVYAQAGTFCTVTEVEDLALAAVRYDRGAVGLVDGCSCFFGGEAGWHLTLLGTKGQARFAFYSGKSEVFLTEAAAGLPAREWVKREFKGPGYGLTGFYTDFAGALRAGNPPPVTGEDGRRALEIVVAIYRSAETGRPVELPL